MPRRKGEAITKLEAAALFFLSDGDKYAYEIEKRIKKFQLRKWLQLGQSTLYKSMEKLEQKGLVSSRSEKVGKMPSRNVFSITKEGRKQLLVKAKELVGQMDNFYLDFNLGLVMLGELLPINTAAGFFKTRLEQLDDTQKEFRDLKEVIADELKEGGTMMVDHLLTFYQTEQRWLKKAIEDAEK